jgi:hypothetical protein
VHQLAVRDIPRSGSPRALLERYGIGRAAIVTAVRALVADTEHRQRRPDEGVQAA